MNNKVQKMYPIILVYSRFPLNSQYLNYEFRLINCQLVDFSGGMAHF